MRVPVLIGCSLLVAGTMSIAGAEASSAIPPCLKTISTQSWDGCVGTIAIGTSRYVGEFKIGQPHGTGVLYTASGLVAFDGMWSHGAMTSSWLGAGENSAKSPQETAWAGYQDYLTRRSENPISDPDSPQSRANTPSMPSGDINANTATLLAEAVKKCRELGFKEKTEKFGRCVLTLSK